MTFYPPGTAVHLLGCDHRPPRPGEVLAATIRADGVRYEVVWWHNCFRHVAWVEPHEIEPLTDGDAAHQNPVR